MLSTEGKKIQELINKVDDVGKDYFIGKLLTYLEEMDWLLHQTRISNELLLKDQKEYLELMKSRKPRIPYLKDITVIKKALKDGYSLQEVLRKYDLTDTQIKEIIK